MPLRDADVASLGGFDTRGVAYPGIFFRLSTPRQDEGAAISLQAADFWRHQWQGRSLMAIGLQDPVLGEAVMQTLQAVIAGCPPPMRLPQAGHFVQEHGQAIAEAAVRHFAP